MRVLHVIDSLSRGGAERQLLLLHQNLLAAGHQSVVAYLGPPAPLHDDYPDVPEVHDLGVGAGKRQLVAAAAAVRRATRRFRPDVMHTSLMYSDLAAAGAALGGIPKVATLCNVLDVDVRRANNAAARAWRMQAANRLWGAALRFGFRHLIAISEAVRDSVTRSLGVPRDRFTIIPRAFTHRRPAGGPPPPVDAPLIVSVGRLVPQKDHATLIAALGRPAVRAEPWRCEIIGEGPERPRLEQLIAELGLDDRVILRGGVPHAAERVAGASLFAFPSRHEGLGVAAVEAASLDVPSIVSNIAPLTEIVPGERFGWLVPPGAPDRWAEAILEALREPARARDKAAALGRRTRARFSPEAMLSATVSVYERVLDPTRPAR